MLRKSFIMTLLFVAFMAGAAIAVDVNISGTGADGTYTLDSMSVAPDGTITLSVDSGVQPPGSPVLSLSPNSLPGGTKDTNYSQNVNMIAQNGSPPYTYNCVGSGVAGITATPTGNTCLISGTPSGSGTYSVTYRVDDDAGKFDQENRSFTVSAPGVPGDPPGVVEVYNQESLKRESITPGGTNYYKFTITQAQSGMQVSISTYDWTTNQDMMISLGSPYPTTADYPASSTFNANGQFINGSQKWAKISPGSSNETFYVFNLPAGTYYVMIHNTSGSSGSYGFGFSAW